MPLLAKVDLGLVVAIIAVALAAASLVWQMFAWRRSRGSRIKVEITRAAAGIGNATLLVLTAQSGSPHAITIATVGYGSKHPLRYVWRWKNVRRSLRRRKWPVRGGWTTSRHTDPIPPGATLPGTLAPFDGGITTYALSIPGKTILDGFGGPDTKLYGWVVTSTQKETRSRPCRARDLPWFPDSHRKLPIPRDLAEQFRTDNGGQQDAVRPSEIDPAPPREDPLS